jgi:hypothetical protein
VRNKTALNARTAAPVTGAEMLEMLEMLAVATVVRTAAPATETASPDSRIARLTQVQLFQPQEQLARYRNSWTCYSKNFQAVQPTARVP